MSTVAIPLKDFVIDPEKNLDGWLEWSAAESEIHEARR